MLPTNICSRPFYFRIVFADDLTEQGAKKLVKNCAVFRRGSPEAAHAKGQATALCVFAASSHGAGRSVKPYVSKCYGRMWITDRAHCQHKCVVMQHRQSPYLSDRDQWQGFSITASGQPESACSRPWAWFRPNPLGQETGPVAGDPERILFN